TGFSKSQLDSGNVYEWVTDGRTDGHRVGSKVDSSPASGHRYHLSSVSDTSPYTVSGAAHTVTGTYVTQYKVSFAQSGVGTDTGSNTVLTEPSPGGTGFSKSQLDSGNVYEWVTDG